MHRFSNHVRLASVAPLQAGAIVCVALLGIAIPSVATTAWAQVRAAVVDPRINAEIATVDAQIQAAEAENSKYTGGLVKALVESRLATLRQTRALLAQRATASDLNVTISYTVDGKPFTLPEGTAANLATVEAELEGMKSKVAAAEAEAARCSGGLVHAMALSTLATARQSQAMLEQKRLALKYGLPQFVGFVESNRGASTPPAVTSAKTTPPPATEKDWEIVDIESKVTESNSTWWKYAWKLTIRNNSPAPHAFRATIEFVDKDQFIRPDRRASRAPGDRARRQRSRAIVEVRRRQSPAGAYITAENIGADNRSTELWDTSGCRRSQQRGKLSYGESTRD